MLPKRKELDKVLKENKARAAKEEIERKEKARIAKIKAQKLAEEKFQRDVEDTAKWIEQDILQAISDGKDATFRLFGKGQVKDLTWETAIVRLKKENKDYTFTVAPTTIQCNNHAQAANIEGVTPKEWQESYWKLTVEW